MRKFVAGGEAVTPVPTAFLAKDMLDAPSDYVKVYLYGLYLAGAGAEASDMSMENKLHMKASEIDQAIRYWVDLGLISVRQSEEGDTYAFRMPGDASEEKREPFPYAAFNLRAKDIAGRELTAADLQRLYFYIENDGMPQEVVLRLLEYCVALKGKNVSIKYVDKVEQTWLEKGACTLKDAEALIDEHKALTGGARQVMRQMGILNKAPGQAELSYYDKWTQEWGFTHEGILAAMANKEFSMGSPFKYLDAILHSYREQGALRAQEITELSAKTESRDARIKEILRALNYKTFTVTPSHVDYYTRWRKEGFSMPIILLACQEVVKDGYMRLEKVDKYLKSWKEMGLLTESVIRAHLARQNETEKLVAQVYELAGIKDSVKETDLRLYMKYTQDHKIDHEALMYAAELSSVKEHPRSYLYSTLKAWAGAGVHTMKQAERYVARRSARRSSKPAAVDYPQRAAPEGVYADQHAAAAVRNLERLFGSDPDV